MNGALANRTSAGYGPLPQPQLDRERKRANRNSNRRNSLPTVMSSVTSPCVENIPGHHGRRSDDHDQLIAIIPERVIDIIPEPVIGRPRNTDRHRPESPRRPQAIASNGTSGSFHRIHIDE